MTVDTNIRQRKSIRLQEYDYSQAGGYFVTICTHEKECLFGEVVDGEMQMNEIGKIVKSEWLKTEEIRDNVSTDEFIIMPNHLHGILFIEEPTDRRCTVPLPLNNLGNQPRIQFPPLFARLRQRSPNKSTNCETPRVFPSGNAVSTTALSATTN